MKPRSPIGTWAEVSRAVGMVIVLALLVAFLVASARGAQLDRTITLAFLSVASFLLGFPSGYQLVVRKRNGTNGGGEDGRSE